MSRGLQGSVVPNLKSEFLEGKNGDLTLKFVCDSKVVETRKCHSLILNQVDYFSAQDKFCEGVAKDFMIDTIDITSFYLGCLVSHREFIESTFLILFDARIDHLDIGSQYSVARFREYLGLSYDDIFDIQPRVLRQKYGFASGADKKTLQRAIVCMLQNCSEELVDIMVERDHFNGLMGHFLDYDFSVACGIINSAMNDLSKDGRLTPRAKILLGFIRRRYMRAVEWETKSLFDLEEDEAEYILPRAYSKVINGFGHGLVRLVELYIECGTQEDLRERWFQPVVRSLLRPVSAASSSEEEWPFLDTIACSVEVSVSKLQASLFLLNDLVRPWIVKSMDFHFPEGAYFEDLESAEYADAMITRKIGQIQAELVRRLQQSETSCAEVGFDSKDSSMQD